MSPSLDARKVYSPIRLNTEICINIHIHLIITVNFPEVILMILSLPWHLEMLMDFLQPPKAASEFGCIFLLSGTSLNLVNQILIKIN